MVGREDTDYVNPETFGKTWNHQDNNKIRKLFDAIQKEISKMTKREVWRKAKKDQIPNN